jgi:hypothetical protein
VEVSIYRASSSAGNGQFELDSLEGFALISETRTVTLPAGPAKIRFEGVASGIEPASALVKGIGIDEKNQNACSTILRARKLPLSAPTKLRAQ